MESSKGKKVAFKTMLVDVDGNRVILTCETSIRPRERENGIYWKDQKDDMDGVTIPTPYLEQFST